MTPEPLRAEFERVRPDRAGIRLSLRALLDAQPALTRLAGEKVPIKLAYTVARMLKAIQPELDEFLTQRNDLIKRYGVARPALSDQERQTHGAEVIEVLPTNLDTYRRDIEALTSVEVTIAREPLALDDLTTIAAADLLALGPLVHDAEI